MDKYPRTFHLNFSPEIHSDDKVINFKYLGNFLDEEVVITEKLDGGNSCLKGKEGVFARSHSSQTKDPWFDYLKSKYYQIQHLIEANEMIFGENMYAIHSIEYTNLNSFFYIFGYKRDELFLSWDEVERKAKELNFPTVPVLFKGKFKSMTEIQRWMDEEIKKESVLGGPREGFVLRIAGQFHESEFSQKVAKYVREGHVQTDEHWSKNWKTAILKKGENE